MFWGPFFKPKSLSALLHLFGETQQQTRHFSFQVSKTLQGSKDSTAYQPALDANNHCSRQLSPDKTLPTEQEKCRNPDSTEAKQPHQTLDRQNDFFIPKCFSNTNVQQSIFLRRWKNSFPPKLQPKPNQRMVFGPGTE